MDNIIPTVIVESLPPLLAGVAIVGPVAASISTVSSLLISSASAIIKDICLHACATHGVQPRERKVAVWSQATTLVIGVIVFVLSIVPPDVIWKINRFAFGGLETAFFFVLVCGLFCPDRYFNSSFNFLCMEPPPDIRQWQCFSFYYRRKRTPKQLKNCTLRCKTLLAAPAPDSAKDKLREP